MASDRIFGLVLLALALAYIASAFTIQTAFMPDPLGSKSFPVMIGALIGICGLAMIAKPDAEPEWPDPRSFVRLGFAVVVLVGYAYALKPMGFLLPTAVASGVLAYQITPRAGLAALTGVGLSVGLFVLFRYGLGLGLMAVPRGLLG
ncbi:MAG: tripartite tricarboxylate transporter TctB family protein [Paracoccaceae bacterium]|nr:tripartite tricarboxylate transporter TctB family protein [Paracoccaceae bacterium]